MTGQLVWVDSRDRVPIIWPTDSLSRTYDRNPKSWVIQPVPRENKFLTTTTLLVALVKLDKAPPSDFKMSIILVRHHVWHNSTPGSATLPSRFHMETTVESQNSQWCEHSYCKGRLLVLVLPFLVDFLCSLDNSTNSHQMNKTNISIETSCPIKRRICKIYYFNK